jgi:hypothetical protein
MLTEEEVREMGKKGDKLIETMNKLRDSVENLTAAVDNLL